MEPMLFNFFLYSNLHLSNDIARFSSSNLRSTISSVILCASIGPSVMINISSRIAYVFLQFVNVRSSLFEIRPVYL